MKPLASLLRPQTIDDIVGQENLLQSQGLVRKMVEKKFVSNLIFYGPPGVGKTSFATALAKDLAYDVVYFNASIDKKDKIDKILAKTDDQKQILVIDEVHRMNQNKQDLLLEHMENGNIVCFFTTTENPYFTINPAIRSRSTILELKRISEDDIFNYLKGKIVKKEIDLFGISDEPLRLLAEMSAGDLRVAINKIELLMNLYADEKIDINLIKRIFDSKANIQGSKSGDIHHDLKSALQKSIRGSDVDAALYWFARMVEAGDFEALMRRMSIIAYEDIGLANPAIPGRVFLACETFRQVGFPEGIIPLGLAIVEMTLSEKSNSAYSATLSAIKAVETGKNFDVPDHLKDSSYKSAKKLKRGIGYKYPHDYPNSYVEQQYLPDEIKDIKFYQPKITSIYEKKVYQIFESFKRK